MRRISYKSKFLIFLVLFITFVVIVLRSENDFISNVMEIFSTKHFESKEFAHDFVLDNFDDFSPASLIADPLVVSQPVKDFRQSIVPSELNSFKISSSYDGNSSATFNLGSFSQRFEGITFYLKVDAPEFVDSLDVFLLYDSENYYHAKLQQSFEKDVWNFVALSLDDFESYGQPSIFDLNELRLDLSALPDKEVDVFVSDLRQVSDNGYVEEWGAIEKLLIQLISFPDESLALSFDNYVERVFNLNRVKLFKNGEILASVYLADHVGRCGLAIRETEKEEHWLLVKGLDDLQWKVFEGSGGQGEFLEEGVLKDFFVSNKGFFWIKIVAIDDLISVFVGQEKDKLTLLATVVDENPRIGQVGVVALDRTRCFYKDIEVHYDD